LTIKDTDTFNKAVKTLKKRFRTIEQDWLAFVNSIQTDEDLGICLGEGIYKTRIANSDKHSGKSGGYRLISYLKRVDNELPYLHL
jgi:mRNA-degrading endonuclease RelE of RelBE toxin-antitoxin system